MPLTSTPLRYWYALLGTSLMLHALPAAATESWTEVIESSPINGHNPASTNAKAPLFPKESATLRYTGLFTATMQLKRQQHDYEITMTANIPFRKMVFRSVGKIVDNQLKPTLFQDSRNDQLYAQATFDYDKKEIRQGKLKDKPAITPMVGQPLDIFSLAWQLTLNHGQMTAPFQVATGKGDVRSHTPASISTERVIRATGTEGQEMNIQMISLANQSNSRYGLATEVGNVPAIFDFEGYALTIEQITIDGQNYGPNGKALP